MEFDLSETQRMMQQSARKFFARECPLGRVRQLMETATAVDRPLWQAVAAQGWIGLTISERWGGLGQGVVDLAAVSEELGRACLPGPYLSTLWAATLLDQSGHDALCAKYLPGLVEGRQLATVALVEAEGDWAPSAVRLTATASDGQVQLDGRKCFVGDAEAADVILCVARGEKGLLLVCVEQGTPGVIITPTPAIDATRKLYEVRFHRAQVPAEQVLAAGPEAASLLAAGTQVATVAACAELVGVMGWILEAAVSYVTTRTQFGRPVGSFQAVQHQCADMLLWTESARSASYYAAWTVTVADPAAPAGISMAKAYCSDAAREVANRGIQVHGGIGFTWEHDLHLFYKRVRSLESLLGDASYHRELLAQYLVDMPAA